MNIRKIFNQAYNYQKNIMTPTIVKYGEIKEGLLFELSKGRGIFDVELFGVTILKKVKNTYEKMYDLSKCFNTKEEANNYIQSLTYQEV